MYCRVYYIHEKVYLCLFISIMLALLDLYNLNLKFRSYQLLLWALHIFTNAPALSGFGLPCLKCHLIRTISFIILMFGIYFYINDIIYHYMVNIYHSYQKLYWNITWIQMKNEPNIFHFNITHLSVKLYQRHSYRTSNEDILPSSKDYK